MVVKNRDQHRNEVVAFLRKNVSSRRWNIELPPYGTGQETYIAQANQRKYFIKLGAILERYQIMSELGFSPNVITTGCLEDRTTILVQEHISGRIPSRSDFQKKLAIFAQIIRDTHQSEHVIRILPERDIESYSQAGLDIIECISRRWKKFRSQVPSVVEYVEEKIEYLKAEVTKFSGSGLVASHNDVCNGNWLIADDGTVYLLDYEGMSLDAFQDGLLEKDELTLRKQAIDREQAQLQSLLAQAQEIRQQNQYRLHTVQDFADFSQRLLETLENPSPEVKSEVIRLLVDHIVVEDNTIVIHHIVPISENERLSLACLHGVILLQYF